MLREVLLAFTFTVLGAVSPADSQLWCFHAPDCLMDPSPFTAGESVEGCCGMPSVVSVWDPIQEMCMECGPPSAERITPRHLALTPPTSLLLEIRATGFTGIAWLRNGTVMHEFPRLQLENFSKTFILSPTEVDDYALYQANVHTVDDRILSVNFVVGAFVPPSVSVSEEATTADLANLTCSASGNPPPNATWFRDDTPVEGQYTFLVDGDLTTLPVTLATVEVSTDGSEIQQYTCIAANDHEGEIGTAQGDIFFGAVSPLILFRAPLNPDISVVAPTLVELFCLSMGTPTPDIRWERDGEAVVGSERIAIELGEESSSLIINRTAAGDGGIYICVASNVAGEVSAFFIVSVIAPPNVTTSTEQEVVNIFDVGRSATFTCTATGSPAPQLVWIMRGAGFLSGHCQGPSLEEVFEEAPLDQAPLDYDQFYTTPAQGDTGLLPSNCSISLIVVDGYITLSTLTITDANEERSSELTCIAENGVVNNVGTPENATVEVILVATPFFLVHPQPFLTVPLSYYADFSCEVIGLTEPAVTWYRNGVEITSIAGGRITIADSVSEGDTGTTVVSTVIINGVEIEDQGRYFCAAVNENGTSNSTFAELTVRAPANITSLPEDVEADISQNVVFSCEAVGSPLPQLRWAQLGPDDQLQFLNDFQSESAANESSISVSITNDTAAGLVASVLEIQNVQLSDQGTYLCLTSNGVVIGNVTTVENASAELLLEVLPTFLITPADSTVTMSQTIIVECSARAVPPPEVYWERFNNRLTNSDRISIVTGSSGSDAFVTSSSLEIRDTVSNDAGFYTCVARNAAGTISVEIRLIVQTSTTVTITPPNFTAVFPDGTAMVECTGVGSPPPQLTWASEQQQLSGFCREADDVPAESPEDIPGDFPGRYERCLIIYNTFPTFSTAMLLILDIKVADAGVYTCQGNNGIGAASETTAILSIEVTPRAIINGGSSTLAVTEGDTLLLECEAFGQPTPEVTWLRSGTTLQVGSAGDPRQSIEAMLVEDDFRIRSVLTISNVLPTDVGEYTCRLDNHDISGLPVVESIQITVNIIDNCAIGSAPGSSPCQNNGTCRDEVGGYACQCTSNFTGDNCTEPTIQPLPPIIVDAPEDRPTELFVPVNFTCQAIGEPRPIYNWFLDGVLIETTDDPHLERPGLPQDRGKYTCIASNALGSSEPSSPALLTISGVYQYLATFVNCSETFDGNFTLLVSQMSECLSSADRSLSGTPAFAIIYSITPRPVQSDIVPEDQVVITLVTNGSSTAGLQPAVVRELSNLTEKFECQFTRVERFDGCPEEDYAFSEEFEEFVTWSESEILQLRSIDCPCGSLNASVHGSRKLTRQCSGTFSFGAVWNEVQDGCDFTPSTFQLCNVSTLALEEQPGALEVATDESSSFNSLDFAIAAVIVQNLATSDVVVGERTFQDNFVGSFDNLLNSPADSAAQSQEQFQSASSLLTSLEIFGEELELDSPGNGNASFQADNLHVQVEETGMEDFLGHTYSPDLSNLTEVFQANVTQTPLQGASINIPGSVVEDLREQGMLVTDPLRVVNFAMLTDLLFVMNRSDTEAVLAQGELMVGNVIITVRLADTQEVTGLSEPVEIRYILTEGLNETNTTNSLQCVFWDQQSDEQFGRWSSEGCELVSMDTSLGEVVCQCNHFTHFALLLDLDPLPTDDAVQFSLQVITYIALALSIICCVIIIATYLDNSELRSRIFGRILVHLCLALTILYAAFLLAEHGRYYNDVPGFCFFVSAVLQYSVLVYFFWTAAEAVLLYLKLVEVFHNEGRHFLLKASLVAWGVPLVIVAICAGTGIKYELYAAYSDGEFFFCRPSSWPFYFGMIAPFALIYIFNWSMFVAIMFSLVRGIHQHGKLTQNEASSNREYRKLVMIAFSLSVMFGLGWIFGLITSVPTTAVSIASQYIFSICIGLQGVFIFILHGVRSTDAKKTWRRWLYRLFCCKKLSEKATSPYNTLESRMKTHPLGGLSSQQQRNPLYDSQEHVLLDATLSTVVSHHDTSPQFEKLHYELQELHAVSLETTEPAGSLPQPVNATGDEFPDIDIGEPLGNGNVTTFINPDALSYASQTLQIEFAEPVPEQPGDEDEEEFTLDIKDLDDLPTVVESRYQYSLRGGSSVVIGNRGADVDSESRDRNPPAKVASKEAETKSQGVRAVSDALDVGSADNVPATD